MAFSVKDLFKRNEAGMVGSEAPGEHRQATMAEEAVDLAKTMLFAIAIALVVRVLIFQPFNIPSGSMKPTLLVGDFIIVSKPTYGFSRASLVWPLTRLPLEGRIDPFGAEPERGDVVVFKNRKDGNKDYIKRVIGLPGDRIEMRRGQLYINGEPTERKLLGDARAECGVQYRYAKAYRETLPNGVSYVIQECADDQGELDDTASVFAKYSRYFPESYSKDAAPVYEVPDGHYFMMGDNRDSSEDSRALHAVGYVPFDDLVGEAEILFFSANGEKAQLWEFWRWPFAIRYGRIFSSVQ